MAIKAQPPGGRQAQRRAQTRERLLHAARDLFSEQGVEPTRINEITDRADVGFGSFYNHFTDKDAIVEEVLRAMAEEQGAAVDELTAGLEDIAEVVSVAHRHFVRLAAGDANWGWLVVRLDASHRVLTAALGPRALRDLLQGIQSGRFHVTDPALTLNTLGGALIGSMRAVLDGQVGPDADQTHAESVLRVLGLSRREAAVLARRPLPVPAARP